MVSRDPNMATMEADKHATEHAGKTKETKEKKVQPASVVSYLMAYNALQIAGWSYLLGLGVYLVMTNTSSPFPHWKFYIAISGPLKIFQTLAILEVIHVVLGFVRSDPVMTAFQVASRLFVVWGIFESLHESRNWGVLLAVGAWCVTEVIRYSFYFFSLMGSVPHLLLWCRYTFFIILYPIGVSGELIAIKAGIDVTKKNDIYSISLPNRANIAFSYHYLLIVAAFAYIPLFPQLYCHMVRQRRKLIKGIFS